MPKQIKISLITFLLLVLAINVKSQVLDSHQKLQTLSSAALSNTASVLGLNVALPYSVDIYKINYFTTDENGNNEIASGMVVIPTDSCAGYPMGLYAHGTVLKRDDVPSRNNGEGTIGKLFAGAGYVMVLPDYLGMGDNPGFHPYVHAETQATASIDAMRAARELCSDLNTNLDRDVFITGYSQGGHAAMATHQYIQENNLQNEFRVRAAAPASGPYDMSGIQAGGIISGSPYSNPGYVVYLIKGYQQAYGNLYNNSIAELLRAPYDVTIPPLLDGTHTLSDLNNAMPSRIDSFMKAGFLNDIRSTYQSKNHPLWQNLLDNDVYNWVPDSATRMYYCTGDEQVEYQNSIKADSFMNAMGAQDVAAYSQGPSNHGGCVVPSLYSVITYFDSLSTPCNAFDTTSTFAHFRSEPELRVYPNPARSVLNVEIAEPATITLYELSGREVMSRELNDTKKLPVYNLNPGVYLLRVVSENTTQLKRVVVSH
jgi:acetyl esterase/lipase